MENKSVGFILLGVSILIVVIIFMFNSTLKEIIINNCGIEHGPVCSMNKNVNQQTYLALGVTFLLVIVSVLLIFSKPNERVVFKTRTIERKPQRKNIDTKSLKSEEKQALNLIQENKTIFQADLIEKTGFGKAKITRILDRLEGLGLVERKRRGMTNVVVLKED